MNRLCSLSTDGDHRGTRRGGGFGVFAMDSLERRVLLSGSVAQTYLTDFTKTDNIYTNLNEEYPHTGTGVPGSGIGTANATFLFNPAPAAVAAAGYAPDYVSGSNEVNNGIDFQLSSDSSGQDFDEINGGQQTTITADLTHVQTVYALLGAYNGQSFNATFTGADGTAQTFNNVSVPDFNGGFINTTGPDIADQTVFQVHNQGAGGSGNSTTGDFNNYGLTEVSFTLQPSIADQELTSISFASNGYMTLLLGVTAARGSGPAKTIGGLDPNFGTAGLASHAVGFTDTTAEAADGSQSILVGTVGSAPNESFGVTRFNADGSLDTAFGSSGVVTTSFSGTDDVPTAVDVPAGGQILVAGTATSYSNGVAASAEFAIAEFNADGSVDTGFGNGTGQVLVRFAASGAVSTDELNAMTVGPAGTIFLGGDSNADGNNQAEFAVAALTASGGVDSSFGAAGKVMQSIGDGSDSINSLALQSNGDLVAAGSAAVGGTTEIALARFLPGGLLDKHFGAAGTITTDVRGVYDSASSVVIQPRGQIVIGGVSATGSGSSLSSDFLLQRYTTAGRLDRTFGGSGTVITSFAQPSGVTQLALQTNGEIVASGKTSANLSDVVPSTLDVALARYTTRGALDATFAGTGKVIIDLSAGVVAVPAFSIDPLDASSLGSAFAEFVGSVQGVVATTAGGEILTAGNSGTNTVEAEVVAAGVDLATSLLGSLPASVLAGAKATVSISIQNAGDTQAIGTVTIELQTAIDAEGDQAVTLKNLGERIDLRGGQSHAYRLAFAYPTGLATGGYYLLATLIEGSTLSDLNPANNAATSAGAITISPPSIMLAGSALAAATPFVPGKLASVSVDLTNDGNILALGKITVELFVSTDLSTADGTEIPLPPLVLALPAGKSHLYRLRGLLPKTLAAGTYNLLALIDPANSLGTADDSDSLVTGSAVVG
jgi:uncharacterized delta-60 repeat protein